MPKCVQIGGRESRWEVILRQQADIIERLHRLEKLVKELPGGVNVRKRQKEERERREREQVW